MMHRRHDHSSSLIGQKHDDDDDNDDGATHILRARKHWSKECRIQMCLEILSSEFGGFRHLKVNSLSGLDALY